MHCGTTDTCRTLKQAVVQVELFHELFAERVMLAAHSWGDPVVRAFLHWMDERAPGWVDRHISVYFACAGPTLGTPKAASALLSGELRESTQLSGLAYLIGESLLGKEDRTAVWRTWGSPLGMLPIGGANVWGNATFAPDDSANATAMGTSLGCAPVGLTVCPWQCAETLPVAATASAVPLCRAMLHVQEVTARSDNSTANVRDCLAWLRGSHTPAGDSATPRRLDAVATVAAIVEDGGPVYLSHAQEWSAAQLPADMEERVRIIYGHERVCCVHVSLAIVLMARVPPVCSRRGRPKNLRFLTNAAAVCTEGWWCAARRRSTHKPRRRKPSERQHLRRQTRGTPPSGPHRSTRHAVLCGRTTRSRRRYPRRRGCGCTALTATALAPSAATTTTTCNCQPPRGSARRSRRARTSRRSKCLQGGSGL